jgi:trans-aconitate methyltransferase
MTYEFDGKKYREASSHQKEWGNRLIEELNISGAERILDLGCGDGTLTARLAELVPRGHVIGTDASSGMIDAAAMHRADNLSFVLKDINDLDYSDEFDVIFSNAALHWVKDHDALLANVHRALGNCGTVRFNFAADGNCRTFFQVVRKAMAHRDFERFFHDFNWPWFMPTVEEYASLVRSSPFTEFWVWGENADHLFSDEDAMIRWIDQPSLVPFLTPVEEPMRESFRSFVVERMLNLTRQAGGGCFETFRRVNIYARK